MPRAIVIGEKEIKRKLGIVLKFPDTPASHKVLIQAAAIGAASVRDLVPVVTGRALRSVESGGFKRRAGKPPAAFVRVNRRIAPHFQFLEFGTIRQQPNPVFSRGIRRARRAMRAVILGGLKTEFGRMRL